MNWTSIDESEPVVVLRGQRTSRRSTPLTLGALAFALQRVIAWSTALTVHLVVAAILVAIWFEARREDDSLSVVSLQRGRAGEEAKVVEAPKAPDPKPEPPQPEPPKPVPEPPKPDPVPEPAPAPPAPAPPAETPAPAGATTPDATPKPATIGGGASAPSNRR